MENPRISFIYLLKFAALLEVAAGLALMLAPSIAAFLLFNANLVEPGLAVGRVAGFGIFSLGIACWPHRQNDNRTTSVLALLTYGALITLYFIFLGIEGRLVGWLLWPTVALHAALTTSLGWKWSKE